MYDTMGHKTLPDDMIKYIFLCCIMLSHDDIWASNDIDSTAIIILLNDFSACVAIYILSYLIHTYVTASLYVMI